MLFGYTNEFTRRSAIQRAIITTSLYNENEYNPTGSIIIVIRTDIMEPSIVEPSNWKNISANNVIAIRATRCTHVLFVMEKATIIRPTA